MVLVVVKVWLCRCRDNGLMSVVVVKVPWLHACIDGGLMVLVVVKVWFRPCRDGGLMVLVVMKAWLHPCGDGGLMVSVVVKVWLCSCIVYIEVVVKNVSVVGVCYSASDLLLKLHLLAALMTVFDLLPVVLEDVGYVIDVEK